MIKGFKMRLYPGQEAEYQRRHSQIWPEMKKMIHDYGLIIQAKVPAVVMDLILVDHLDDYVKPISVVHLAAKLV